MISYNKQNYNLGEKEYDIKVENTTINAAVDLLIESDIAIKRVSKDGLIKQVSKRILEKILQVEMDDH